MKTPQEFDDIRAFNDDEVQLIVPEILKQPQIVSILNMILGEDLAEYFLRTLAPMNCIKDFQREVIIALLAALEHKTCKSVNLYGAEKISHDEGHLFISNHRDIVLDSAFLNEHLFYKGFDTTQIGIGNNLLIYPWIEKLVRINKSFIVKRDGSIKEQLLISKKLSKYIRFVICENKESVWLAQREGRAKDSDDRTQHSVIKMLAMSADKDFVSGINELKIMPVSINYEYDPCDYLKAKEMQQKRDDASFAKSPADDLFSMQNGIMGPKGRVSFVVSNQLEFSAEVNKLGRQEMVTYVAEQIDKAIHLNYILYPNNYIAADLFTGASKFTDKYDSEQKARFVSYIQSRIDMINLPGKDEDFLRKQLYAMYGNPALNKAAAEGK